MRLTVAAAAAAAMLASNALAAATDGVYDVHVAGTVIPDVIVVNGLANDDRLIKAGLLSSVLAVEPSDIVDDVVVVDARSVGWQQQRINARRVIEPSAPVRGLLVRYSATAGRLPAASINALAVVSDRIAMQSAYNTASPESRSASLSYSSDDALIVAGRGIPGRSGTVDGLSVRLGASAAASAWSDAAYRPRVSVAGKGAAVGAVDVFVNGAHAYRGRVRPGDYKIDDIARLSSSGRVDVQFTGVDGSIEKTSFFLPGADVVLARGAFDLGADYDVRGGRFVDAFAKYGITEHITAGAAFSSGSPALTLDLATKAGDFSIKHGRVSEFALSSRIGSNAWLRGVYKTSGEAQATFSAAAHGYSVSITSARSANGDRRNAVSASYKNITASASERVSAAGEKERFFSVFYSLSLGKAGGGAYVSSGGGGGRFSYNSDDMIAAVDIARDADGMYRGGGSVVYRPLHSPEVRVDMRSRGGKVDASATVSGAVYVGAPGVAFGGPVRGGYAVVKAAPGALIHTGNRLEKQTASGLALLSVPTRERYVYSADHDDVTVDHISVSAAARPARGVYVDLVAREVGFYISHDAALPLPLPRASMGYYAVGRPGDRFEIESCAVVVPPRAGDIVSCNGK